jgi:hypothetical protein
MPRLRLYQWRLWNYIRKRRDKKGQREGVERKRGKEKKI